MVMISRGINYSFSLAFSSGSSSSLSTSVDAGAVNRAELAEPARTQGAFAFQLRLRLDREPRPRNRFQPRLGNRLAGQFADAVGLFLDALERLLDFIDRVLVGRQQAQREIAVKIVRARIGHVQAVTGQFLRGFLGQAVHLPEQLLAQFQQPLVILLPLRLDLLRVGRRPWLSPPAGRGWPPRWRNACDLSCLFFLVSVTIQMVQVSGSSRARECSKGDQISH